MKVELFLYHYSIFLSLQYSFDIKNALLACSWRKKLKNNSIKKLLAIFHITGIPYGPCNKLASKELEQIQPEFSD